MTMPNMNDPDQMPDAVNAGSGISGATSTTPAQHMQNQFNQIGSPFGGVIGSFFSGIAGGVIADAQDSAETGATQSYTTAAQKASARIAGVRSNITNPFSIIQDIIDALLSVLRGIPIIGGLIPDLKSEFQGLKSTSDNAYSGVSNVRQGIVEGWFDGEDVAGGDPDVIAVMASIRNYAENGWTVTAHTFSETWVRPANLNELTVVLFGGGQNGAAGKTPLGLPDAPSVGGGFYVLPLSGNVVPATVALTVGTAGNPSSFGSFVTTIPGQTAMVTEFGFVPIPDAARGGSMPGNGGQGGYWIQNSSNSNVYTQATAGGSNALAQGGARGAIGGYTQEGRPGGDGGSVAVDSYLPCGGAGGGGGGGGGDNGIVAYGGGDGGAGGFPGGAGGHGGNKSPGYGTGGPGAGGPGAPGLILIYTR